MSVSIIASAGSALYGGSFVEAAKKLHPDAGGDPRLFRAAVKARDLIGAGA